MGQTFRTLARGGEEKKANEIGPIIDKCYDDYFADTQKIWNSADFYRAICETVEEINKKLGSTQFRIPKTLTLDKAYKHHHGNKNEALTKEEFQRILQDVIIDTGFTGSGGTNILFYIFGVPATALLVKQRIIPKAIPNEIFIPCVTSATVFILAKLNKI